ncbi:alpha/beta-hydrolase [Violaceomyces palustris]|uniref:Alpha/beta-hydrolase n=1 Tax=Violaceomyces palustris TaxID=1673888 RepID=A0ACD0P8N1_9BASI|nr:alpha/beta-hydrolase [Violaceomyces palustris]
MVRIALHLGICHSTLATITFYLGLATLAASALPNTPPSYQQYQRQHQSPLNPESRLPPYLTLPSTPKLPDGGHRSRLERPDGSSIWHVRYPAIWHHNNQRRPTVTFLHGGFSNSDYWGIQIEKLLGQYPILAIDSRGHGRSTEADDQPITYEAMTEDVVAVLDHLGIDSTVLVGWSDGGIIGLDMALRHRQRLKSLFAFGASYSYSNINTTIDQSHVFNRFLNRTEREYRKLNPRPDHLATFEAKMNTMWATLPDWDQSTFEGLVSGGPTDGEEQQPLIFIVDGAEEEAVNRTTAPTLHDWIPGSGLTILPLVSHFGFMQDPSTFNAMLERFLEW